MQTLAKNEFALNQHKIRDYDTVQVQTTRDLDFPFSILKILEFYENNLIAHLFLQKCSIHSAILFLIPLLFADSSRSRMSRHDFTRTFLWPQCWITGYCISLMCFFAFILSLFKLQIKCAIRSAMLCWMPTWSKTQTQKLHAVSKNLLCVHFIGCPV